MTLYLVVAFGLMLGGAIGMILGKGIVYLIRSFIVASDKSKIRTAMAREAYLNNLYEECLFEEQDRLARKAAREMSYYDR
jgi:acid phosphatase family membrane protein YuiD